MFDIARSPYPEKQKKVEPSNQVKAKQNHKFDLHMVKKTKEEFKITNSWDRDPLDRLS